MRVLIFWDSIAEWYYDCNRWGWANRLKTSYWNTDRSIEVWLCGISGDEIPNIIKRFDVTTKWFIEKFQDEVIFVFAVWINDSVLLKWKEELHSAEMFTKNIQKLIDLANKYNPRKIIFTWLTYVNEEFTNPLKASKTWKCYRNARIKKFNMILKKESLNYSCEFIDILNLLNNNDLDDGIHPNAQWHKKMFEYINTKLTLI